MPIRARDRSGTSVPSPTPVRGDGRRSRLLTRTLGRLRGRHRSGAGTDGGHVHCRLLRPQGRASDGVYPWPAPKPQGLGRPAQV